MLKCNFNKVLCNFIEIALRHGCSPVNLLHIFRTAFLKNTSGQLLLLFLEMVCYKFTKRYTRTNKKSLVS